MTEPNAKGPLKIYIYRDRPIAMDNPDGVPTIFIGDLGKIKPNNQPKPGPIGNTQGMIFPETNPSISGTTSAPTPEGPPGEKKGWWKSWGSDVTHGILDVVGLFPVLGEPANLLGAGIYLLEGDKVSAAMDIAAMWPAGGQASTVAKNAMKHGGEVLEQAVKKADDVGETLAKQGDNVAETTGKQADNATDAGKKQNGGKIPQKPHKNCGKFGPLNTLETVAELERDHVPSGAALKKALTRMMEKMPEYAELSPKQRDSILSKLYQEAPAVSIPKDVHAEGDTWRYKNNADQIDRDSKDLKKAVDRDTKTIQKSMDGKDHGCSDAYREAAEKFKNFDYDDLMKKVIDTKFKEYGLR